MSETDKLLAADSVSEYPQYTPWPSTRKSVDTQFTATSWIYDFVLWIFTACFDIFFREVRPRGAFRIPRKGPVLFVAAPHANQFVDPVILMNQVKQEAGRRISFLVAEKSMRRAAVGRMARSMSSIPVVRAQDNAKKGSGKIYVDESDPTKIHGIDTEFTKQCEVRGLVVCSTSIGSIDVAEIISDTLLIARKEFKGHKAKEALKKENGGVTYKYADYVNQATVYRSVFDKLHHGGCVGIFPEGGSHDRTDLLPLKAGVAIMALGALAEDPSCGVRIVPCGLNYFHAHKFRSRAVVEFGSPIAIPPDLVEKYKSGGDAKREAVKTVLDITAAGLKSVTVQVQDYDTLMLIQAIRRLYRPPGKKIPLPMVVELNRRLVHAYNHYKDDPRIEEMKKEIRHYNKFLQAMGLKDHQVEKARVSKIEILGRLIYRSMKLIILAIGCLPGLLLFSPIFIISKSISITKAKEALKASSVKIKANDVVATWKVLVAMGLTPILYIVYSIVGSIVIRKLDLISFFPTILLPGLVLSILVGTSYAALAMGEAGMDIFKSLRPLALALNPSTKNALLKLQNERKRLVLKSSELVTSLGPELFPDFHQNSILQGSENFEDEENYDTEKSRSHSRSTSATSLSAMSEGDGDELVREVRKGASYFAASTTSDDEDQAISRVNSEASLANIPMFGISRSQSGSSLSDVSSHGASTGNDTEENKTEVTRRIALAMEEKRREQDDE